MGVDLTLIPVAHEGEDHWCGFTLLDCERRRDIFTGIEIYSLNNGEKIPVPFECKMHDDGRWGKCLTDKYGSDLRYLTTKQLIRFENKFDRSDYTNLAVWAYLKMLPPKKKVVLFWH